MPSMYAEALWLVFATGNPKFPFRIVIRRRGEDVLAVWAQDKWPGSGKQIFCLREGEPDGSADDFPEVERARVTHLERYGKQLSVILDRPTRKRCNFLFVKKRYRNKPGNYEQIFFRTQQAMRQHRSAGRVHLHAHGAYNVVVDSAERYPWKFGGVPTERRSLAAGDYAVEIDHRIVAVAERKTFDNLLSDFSSVRVLHAKLDDLARWPHAAMVIEAQYRDFLDPKRLDGRWPATHAARVLAELHVLHPQIQIVYAGSRKSAEQWCTAWFSARAKAHWHNRQDRPAESDTAGREVPTGGEHPTGRGFPAGEGRSDETAWSDTGSARNGGDTSATLGEAPPIYGADIVRSPVDAGSELRRTILLDEKLPRPFSIADLRTRFPAATDGRIRSELHRLRDAGKIVRTGGGRASRWHRVSDTESGA